MQREQPPQLPMSQSSRLGPERAVIQIRQEQPVSGRARERVRMASLPPAPRPTGLARLVSILLGGPL
ncbi:MAG TPA: hypothetical protein VFU32_02405, partial [Ktedonobacterales bacterium]|nr:hypothetical protein [Ktedonobacterales bacterium]